MKKIFGVFLLLLTCLSARSTHIVGGEITYDHLGLGKYEVYITVYRDCNGVQVSQSNLIARSGNNVITVSNQTKISVRDVTGLQSGCSTQSRCSGSFPYGYEEHVYTGTLDLSSYSACEWDLSWEQCCRNGSITTGSANENFYLHAYLNKCTPGSSPKFNQTPKFLLCHNTDQSIDVSVQDTVDSQDSFSYHLVAPLTGNNASVTYNGQFTPTRPLTFFGYPNQNLSWPAGFRMDTTTGVILFRPTQVNQVAPIAVMIKEWRWVNGSKTLVGYTVRDFQVQSISCPNNNPPNISPPYASVVCMGDTLKIDVVSTDDDSQDSTTLEMTSSIPGLTFTNTNGQERLSKGSITWVPDRSRISSTPYIVMVRVTDNACPVASSRLRAFSIYVRDTIAKPIFNAGPDLSASLGSDSIQLQGWDSVNTNHVYWLTMGDGTFSQPNSGNATYHFGPDDRNRCEIQLIRKVFAQGFCYDESSDTMTIFNTLGNIDAGPDSVLWDTGMNITLHPIVPDSSQQIYWTHTGNGYFMDSTEWNATYIPDSSDQTLCEIQFILHRNIAGSCSNTVDTVNYTVNHLFWITMIRGNQNDSIEVIIGSVFQDSINWTSASGQSGTVASGERFTYFSDSSERQSETITINASQQTACGNLSGTSTINIFPNGLNRALLKPEINMYPNPASEAIKLDWDEKDKPAKLIIYDDKGAAVVNRALRSGEQVSTATLPSGAYTIELAVEGFERVQQRLIIRH